MPGKRSSGGGEPKRTVRVKRKPAPKKQIHDAKIGVVEREQDAASNRDRAAAQSIFLPNALTGTKKKTSGSGGTPAPPGKLAKDRLELELGLGAKDKKKWERQPDMAGGVPNRPPINKIRDPRLEPFSRDRADDVRGPVSAVGRRAGQEVGSSGVNWGRLVDAYLKTSPAAIPMLEKWVAENAPGAARAVSPYLQALAIQGSAGVPLASNASSGTVRGARSKNPEVVKRAQEAVDMLVGGNLVNAAGGGEYNPAIAAVEAAMLPFGWSKSLGTAGLRTALRGGNIARAARAGAGGAEAAKSLNTPLVSSAWRTFREGGAVAKIPAARSRTGRAGERLFDAARPYTSKVGVGKVSLVKSETKKTAQAYAQRARHDAKVQMLPAVELKRVMGGLRKRYANEYALRSLALGIDPLEAAEYHAKMAREATDQAVEANHLLHMNGYLKASRLVVRNGDELELAASAPERLRTAWRLLPETSSAREDILKGLGLLDEDQIAARIQSPGRIYKGAKYVAEDVYADSVVRNSPQRQKLLETMLEQIPANAAQAQIRILDEQARAAYQSEIKELRRLAKKYRKAADTISSEVDEGLRGEDELRQAASYRFTADEAERQISELPYDFLYQRLDDTGVGVPDWLRRQMRADNPDKAIHFRESKSRVLSAVGKAMEGFDWAPFRDAGQGFDMDLMARAIVDGADHRFWYEESAAAILEMAGGDKELADRLAQLVAIYSAQRAPGPNMQLAFNAFNEWRQTGIVSSFGTGPQKEKANAILAGEPWDGRKTDRFYANMLEDIDPEKYAATFPGGEVTNDIWMARLFGLKDKAGIASDNPTAKEYEAMQKFIQDVAAELGWKPKQVQAATWIAKKSYDEGTDLPTAAYHFGDAIRDESGIVPFEAAPGQNVVPDLYEQYAQLSPEMKRSYTAEKAQAVNEFLGSVENLLAKLGDEGVGVYEMQTNPGWSVFVAASRGKGKANDLLVTQEARDQLDWVSAAIGDALNQDSAAWLKPFFRKNIAPSKRNGYKIELGRPVTEEEAIALNRELGGDVALVHAPDGMYALNLSDVKNVDFHRNVSEAAGVVYGDEGFDGATFASDGNYFTKDDYAAQLERTGRGRSDLQSGALADLRAASDEIDARYFGDAAPGREPGAAARGTGGVDDAAGRVHDPAERYNPAGAGGRSRTTIRRGYESGILGTPPRGGSFIHGVHASRPDPTDPLGRVRLSEVYTSDRTATPTETWFHELAHFWQSHFAKNERLLTRHYGPDKEKWVEGWLEYVIDAYPQRNLPTKVKQSFKEMSDSLLGEASRTGGVFERGMLIDHPDAEKLAEVFDSTLWYKEIKGGKIRGAEDFTDGQAYTLFEMGLPYSLRNAFATQRRASQSVMGLFGGKTIAQGFVDPSVKKEFQGHLIRSGFFKSDVTNASFKSLAKAVKMDAIRKARTFLLDASTEVPSHTTDIPIYVEPKKAMPKKLRAWFSGKEDLPPKLKHEEIKIGDIDNYGDDNFFADLTKQFFPNEINGENHLLVAEKIINGVTEPIENVRWVKADLLYEGDMFANPKAFFSRGDSWGGIEALGTGVDFVNDLMKLSVLQLNPAYIGMNLMGNLALNLMQQGPFALMNLPRAALLSRELGAHQASAIDHLMGRGISSMLSAKSKILKPSSVLADLTGELVDKVPRRAAFLHEARAKGYKTAEDIGYLLSDKNAADDLYEITTRANDAIIDYERLSPFERKYITRILFIYPWIKGATRYTFRFPLEHPAQALAFAYLYTRQQELADEKLGERPWYAEFNIPIGEVNRYGESYPLVVNPKQLLPFTTPVEFAQALGSYFAPGQNWPDTLDMLQPFYPALVASLTGYDSFEQKEVGTGIGTFFRQAADIPILSAIDRFNQTPEERADAASNKLYPRNETDDTLRTFLGSLAPTPYNPESGQRLAKGVKGYGQQYRNKEQLDRLEKAGLLENPELRSVVLDAHSWKVKWEAKLEQERKRLGTSKLDDVQETSALIDLAAEKVPDLNVSGLKEVLSHSSAGEIRGAMEKLLGWNALDELSGKAGDIEDARADGTVTSAR